MDKNITQDTYFFYTKIEKLRNAIMFMKPINELYNKQASQLFYPEKKGYHDMYICFHLYPHKSKIKDIYTIPSIPKEDISKVNIFLTPLIKDTNNNHFIYTDVYEYANQIIAYTTLEIYGAQIDQEICIATPYSTFYKEIQNYNIKSDKELFYFGLEIYDDYEIPIYIDGVSKTRTDKYIINIKNTGYLNYHYNNVIPLSYDIPYLQDDQSIHIASLKHDEFKNMITSCFSCMHDNNLLENSPHCGIKIEIINTYNSISLQAAATNYNKLAVYDYIYKQKNFFNKCQEGKFDFIISELGASSIISGFKKDIFIQSNFDIYIHIDNKGYSKVIIKNGDNYIISSAYDHSYLDYNHIINKAVNMPKHRFSFDRDKLVKCIKTIIGKNDNEKIVFIFDRNEDGEYETFKICTLSKSKTNRTYDLANIESNKDILHRKNIDFVNKKTKVIEGNICVYANYLINMLSNINVQKDNTIHMYFSTETDAIYISTWNYTDNYKSIQEKKNTENTDDYEYNSLKYILIPVPLTDEEKENVYLCFYPKNRIFNNNRKELK